MVQPDALLQERYSVIAFDPRGIGKSERPKQPYAFKALADDVVGLMDRVGAGKAHVLGRSLGGLAAQEVAIDCPERVSRLVLVSSTAAGENANPANPALVWGLGTMMGLAASISQD